VKIEDSALRLRTQISCELSSERALVLEDNFSTREKETPRDARFQKFKG